MPFTIFSCLHWNGTKQHSPPWCACSEGHGGRWDKACTSPVGAERLELYAVLPTGRKPLTATCARNPWSSGSRGSAGGEAAGLWSRPPQEGLCLRSPSLQRGSDTSSSWCVPERGEDSVPASSSTGGCLQPGHPPAGWETMGQAGTEDNGQIRVLLNHECGRWAGFPLKLSLLKLPIFHMHTETGGWRFPLLFSLDSQRRLQPANLIRSFYLQVPTVWVGMLVWKKPSHLNCSYTTGSLMVLLSSGQNLTFSFIKTKQKEAFKSLNCQLARRGCCGIVAATSLARYLNY